MTARGARFPLFMALREVSDVIEFDQRSTGMSQALPVCIAKDPPPASEPLVRDSIVAFYRREVARCFDWWEANGADIDGYTTKESAHDVDDLRRALGVETINLWGISYGSHLGLAVLKYHPKSVERAVLAGIEGPDETVKLPSQNDAYFARVQALIDADPAAKAVYPDLAGMMRRVHARLNATPATATFTPAGASAPITVTFDGFAVQLLASGSIADPSAVRRLPLLYLALDNGQYAQAAQLLYGQFLARPPMFNGMPEAMDLASGISPARMARLEKEFRTAILGDTLNFPMPHIAGIRPQIDLGEGFRAYTKSDVPTLFISGTLDGRTYPAEAAANVAGFSRGARLIVENGGHNIYEADPRIGEAVVAWFTGKPAPATIRFEPPKFAVP
jgi:pimeloyl-ACP methyl ester carboxylesterase